MTGRSDPGERRPDWAALAISVAMLAAAALVLWDMRHISGMGSYSRVGPTAFPTMLAGGLVVVAAGIASEALRGLFLPRDAMEWSPVLWIVAGLVAQILLLRTAGFSIATGVVFAFTARGMGRGPLWRTIPIGILFALLVFLIFARGLQLTLPRGPLEHLLLGLFA